VKSLNVVLLALAACAVFVAASPPTSPDSRKPFVNSAGLTMVPIEAGSFYMGSPGSEPGRFRYCLLSGFRVLLEAD
jgi:formylglycine-generating enzyme required for sulfatase activity